MELILVQLNTRLNCHNFGSNKKQCEKELEDLKVENRLLKDETMQLKNMVR